MLSRQLSLREEFQRTDSVAILVGEVAEDRNPYTGERVLRRLEVRRPERMPEFQTFRPTETTVAPAFYYVPAELKKVIALLEAHGVRLDPERRRREGPAFLLKPRESPRAT